MVNGVDRLLLRQLEAFVIGLFKPFTMDDLKLAVKEKWLLVSNIPKDLKTRKMVVIARRLVRQATEEEKAEFTPETVAEWICRHRPEVASFFLNSKAFRRWFKVNIKAIRVYFSIDPKE